MQRKTRTAIATACASLGLVTATAAQEAPPSAAAPAAEAGTEAGPASASASATEVDTATDVEAEAQAEPTAEALTAEERAVYERLVALDAALEYQSGEIPLGDGLATLRLPDSLRYMDPENTERLLVEGWGNPNGAGTLGMIVPVGSSPISGDSWGVVLSYDEGGYVSDDDADGIDYDALLEEMKASTEAEKAKRAEQGFEQVELVGWAERPRYDATSHKLFWAKELAFEGSPSNTLNYNVRVLGRRGVLVLNAVASMDQLELIRAVMPAVIAAAEFDEGHRYADYQPGRDEVAAYGLAALVAGGVAAKPGVAAELIAFIGAGRKLVIPALVAVFAAVGFWLRPRRPQEATSASPRESTATTSSPNAPSAPTAPPPPTPPA